MLLGTEPQEPHGSTVFLVQKRNHAVCEEARAGKGGLGFRIARSVTDRDAPPCLLVAPLCISPRPPSPTLLMTQEAACGSLLCWNSLVRMVWKHGDQHDPYHRRCFTLLRKGYRHDGHWKELVSHTQRPNMWCFCTCYSPGV